MFLEQLTPLENINRGIPIFLVNEKHFPEQLKQFPERLKLDSGLGAICIWSGWNLFAERVTRVSYRHAMSLE